MPRREVRVSKHCICSLCFCCLVPFHTCLELEPCSTWNSRSKESHPVESAGLKGIQTGACSPRVQKRRKSLVPQGHGDKNSQRVPAWHQKVVRPSFLPSTMSAAAARFLFIVVVVLNVVLWSSGRYDQSLAIRSIHQKESSLVRRISYELMNPGEMHTSEDQVSAAYRTFGSGLMMSTPVLPHFFTA
jgi:hypothetical protein